MVQGRGPPTNQRCRGFHAFLIEHGIEPGDEVPRPVWDRFMTKSMNVSAAQIRNITRTGELMDLWRRLDHVGPIAGRVLIMPEPQA